MQGTIATFDADSRSGTLLLDNGAELAFDAAAFDGSGLRHLRLGQRVDIESDPSGAVQRVRIPGIA
jgi:cold shock CspA family protein